MENRKLLLLLRIEPRASSPYSAAADIQTELHFIKYALNLISDSLEQCRKLSATSEQLAFLLRVRRGSSFSILQKGDNFIEILLPIKVFIVIDQKEGILSQLKFDSDVKYLNALWLHSFRQKQNADVRSELNLFNLIERTEKLA